MRRLDRVLEYLRKSYRTRKEGLTAEEVAEALGLARSNASADLNNLWREGLLTKTSTRPVRYLPATAATTEPTASPAPKSPAPPAAQPPATDPFDSLVGAKESLASAVKQAKAAVLYPGGGLHTLIVGPTGVGKSRLVELMYQFAAQSAVLKPDGRLVTFNCADYAHNPQLLLAHLFGVVKGAYTGAERDQTGLVEQADGGILFLDEVHRLVPEGQEMLFRLIDKGLFRRLGESHAERKARTLIVCATTERLDSSLLRTFTRRIPMVINLPGLADRTLRERLKFIKHAFHDEARKMAEPLNIPPESLRCLMLYDCPGNIGQLNSDIQLACAQAFLRYLSDQQSPIEISLEMLPDHVKRQLSGMRHRNTELEELLQAHAKGLLLKPESTPQQAMADEPVTALPNFYEFMEQETVRLAQRGNDAEAIQAHLGASLEAHFQHFLTTVQRRYQAGRQELTAVVDKRVLAAVEQAVALAEGQLRRVVPQRVVFGLALHVSAALERVALNTTVPYPPQESIEAKHPQEYAAAGSMVKLLSNILQVRFPPGEVGYTALFLAASNESERPAVGLAVACHGEGIAEGMAEVAQHLAGQVGVLALDMPLDQSPETVLARLTDWVRQEEHQAVLLLVDMGSLAFLAGQLQTSTGVAVRVVPMASTILLIEAIQQIQLPGTTLDQVFDAVVEAQRRLFLPKSEEGRLPPTIVTCCFTGQGNALLLKKIVEKSLRQWDLAAEIITTSITPGPGGERMLHSLLGGRKPAVVIGPVNPHLPGVPFLSSAEIVTPAGQDRLHLLLQGRGDSGGGPATPLRADDPRPSQIAEPLAESLAEHFRFSNPHTLLPQAVAVVEALEGEYGVKLPGDIQAGLLMHLALVVESRAADRTASQTATALDPQMLRVQRCLAPLARAFQVTFLPEDLIRIHEIMTNTLGPIG